jgi:hypothetical protein
MKKSNSLLSSCGRLSSFKVKISQISTDFCKTHLPTFLIASTIFLILPHISFAGTGGEELKTVYDKTIEIAQGYGGKLAAGVAFVISLVAAVRGNLMAFGSALGVSILAGVGPEIFTSGVSAII